MSAESGIQFPKGDALTVYKSVYEPISLMEIFS